MKSLFYSVLLSVFLLSCVSSDKDPANGSSSTPSKVEVGKVQKVSFKAADGLEIIADYYPVENPRKFIVLCHQDGYSRGAYNTIAPKLNAKGYACLAIDQRVGSVARDVLNETYVNAVKAGQQPRYQDAQQDIAAALDYAASISDAKLVLWGSSYSATLAMMMGKEDKRIAKVVAFSPGLYFGSEQTVVSAIKGYNKPVFVSCAKSEKDRVFQFAAHVGANALTFFEPEYEGMHGSRQLWVENQSTEQLWAALFAFLNN